MKERKIFIHSDNLLHAAVQLFMSEGRSGRRAFVSVWQFFHDTVSKSRRELLYPVGCSPHMGMQQQQIKGLADDLAVSFILLFNIRNSFSFSQWQE